MMNHSLHSNKWLDYKRIIFQQSKYPLLRALHSNKWLDYKPIEMAKECLGLCSLHSNKWLDYKPHSKLSRNILFISFTFQ